MIQMPFSRAKSSNACCWSRGITQPVGLFGELMNSARVSASQESISRSISSCQPSLPIDSSTGRTSPPIMRTVSAQFGQSGLVVTTLVPASTSDCIMIWMAFMPEAVMTMRSDEIGRPHSGVRYSASASRSSGTPALSV